MHAAVGWLHKSERFPHGALASRGGLECAWNIHQPQIVTKIGLNPKIPYHIINGGLDSCDVVHQRFYSASLGENGGEESHDEMISRHIGLVIALSCIELTF